MKRKLIYDTVYSIKLKGETVEQIRSLPFGKAKVIREAIEKTVQEMINKKDDK